MPQTYDISLPIESGGAVYPENAPIEIATLKSVATGGSSTISRITFGSHTATHVDAQSHFVATGKTVDQIPLDVLMGPAVLIRFPDDVMAITAALLEGHGLAGQTRVLLATRNSGFNRERAFRRTSPMWRLTPLPISSTSA